VSFCDAQRTNANECPKRLFMRKTIPLIRSNIKLPKGGFFWFSGERKTNHQRGPEERKLSGEQFSDDGRYFISSKKFKPDEFIFDLKKLFSYD